MITPPFWLFTVQKPASLARLPCVFLINVINHHTRLYVIPNKLNRLETFHYSKYDDILSPISIIRPKVVSQLVAETGGITVALYCIYISVSENNFKTTRIQPFVFRALRPGPTRLFRYVKKIIRRLTFSTHTNQLQVFEKLQWENYLTGHILPEKPIFWEKTVLIYFFYHFTGWKTWIILHFMWQITYILVKKLTVKPLRFGQLIILRIVYQIVFKRFFLQVSNLFTTRAEHKMITMDFHWFTIDYPWIVINCIL